MKISVTYPLVNYGFGAWSKLEEDRQQIWGSRLAIKITSPCTYCGEPVTYIRGAIFNGDKYHWECYRDSGDQAKQAEAFQKAVCGELCQLRSRSLEGTEISVAVGGPGGVLQG